MKQLKVTALAIMAVITVASCSKSDTAAVSQPQIQVGQPVSSAAPLSGSIKGTMLSGQVYAVTSDVTITPAIRF